MAVTTHTATTGSGGAFSDTIPGEGKFTAVATAVLTTPGGTELIVTSNTVKIAANYDVSIAFVDDGNGTISGALLGDEGTTVDGVVVTLTIVDGDGNTTTATVTTDSDGNFSYTLTAPGDYTITATATVTTALGTKDIASDELDAELVLPDEGAITCAASASGETATISGALSASSWLSVADRTVILTITDSAGTSTTATATTDSSGNYSVDWEGETGTYSVVASCVVSDSLTVTSDAVAITLVDSSLGEHAGALIYSENFSERDSVSDLTKLTLADINNFPASSVTTYSFTAEDGAIKFIKTAMTQIVLSAFFKNFSISDGCVITLKAKINLSGGAFVNNVWANGAAGIFLSSTPDRIGWAASINPTTARVSKITSSAVSHASYTFSTTDRSEIFAGEELNIRIECKSGTVKLYLNDILLVTNTNTLISSGYIGLLAGQSTNNTSYQSTHFYEMKVYEYVD